MKQLEKEFGEDFFLVVDKEDTSFSISCYR